MKKSMIISISGIILVFLVLQVMAKKSDLYVKTKYYDNKEEVIADFIRYSNTYEKIKVDDNSFTTAVPKDFKETISLRYRTYIKNNNERFINFFIEFLLNYELEEINEDYIVEDYNKTFKWIKNYKKSDDITYYKLTGDSILNVSGIIDRSKFNEDGTISLEALEITQEELDEGIYYIKPATYYFVVVDEGEGYVVDYYRAN